MKLPRRQLLHLATGAAVLSIVSRVARAQSYPTQPVRIFEGFGPGSAVDVLARPLAQSLSERLGEPFEVENRVGAAGNVAASAVARAAADGYTLCIVGPGNAINAVLFGNLDFNFARDIAPVATIARIPGVMVVHPSFPAKTVPEFIAYAKANPGKINMGSAGYGSATHLFGELFKAMAGVDLYHNGSYADVVAGKSQVMFELKSSSINDIRSGKLRALAAMTTTRLELLPDLPTVAQFVPGYEASIWNGIGAPKKTPAEIIEKLNNAINASLAEPTLKARFVDLGVEPMSMSSADFRKLIADDTEKWGRSSARLISSHSDFAAVEHLSMVV